MRKNYWFGVMALVAFSACGKSLSLTQKGLSELNSGKNVAGAGTAAGKEVLNGKQPLKLDNSANKLSALSDQDWAEVSANLPYKNLTDLGHATQDIGNAAYGIYNGKKTDPNSIILGSHRFVKASNLVFRSVQKIPSNRDAVKGVTSMKLTLKNVRMVSDLDSTKRVLSQQMLCVIDTKKCSGELQSDSANRNVDYGTPLNDKFAKLGLLTSEHVIENGDQGELRVLRMANVDEMKMIQGIGASIATGLTGVPTAKPTDAEPAEAKVKDASAVKKIEPELADLTIDLKEVFELSDDATAIAWIYDNSKEFSDQYRKFRFVMGNNVYASGGTLNIDLDLDKTKLAKGYKNIAMNNLPDMTRNQDRAIVPVAEVLDVNRTLLETDLVVDASSKLDEASAKKIKELVSELGKSIASASIQKIMLVESYDGTLAGDVKTAAMNVAKAKAKSIVAEIQKNGYPGKIIAGAHAVQDCSTGMTLQIRLSPDLNSADRAAQTDAINKILDAKFPKASK